MTLPLFVYGTLLADSPQGALLGGLERRAAYAHGHLYAMPAGYPALVPGGDAAVWGELVAAPPDALLAVLDAYEGVHEGLYRRDVIDVISAGRTIRAWAYVMDRPEDRGGRRVASGRWKAVRKR